MYITESDFKYQSSSKGDGPYNLEEIIDIIIRNKMQNIRGGINLNRITDNYPAGTVGRWLQEINTLRVLYDLYGMESDKIDSFFENYEIDDILIFNKEIENLVIKRIDISNDIKTKYLLNIDKFNKTLIDNTMEENSKVTKKDSYDLVIKFIKDTEESWNLFADKHKKEIFELIYKNEEMLMKCIEEIL